MDGGWCSRGRQTPPSCPKDALKGHPQEGLNVHPQDALKVHRQDAQKLMYLKEALKVHPQVSPTWKRKWEPNPGQQKRHASPLQLPKMSEYCKLEILCFTY